MWDGSTEEARAEWQSKIDGADVLIMDELALLYLGSKVDGKKVIALQHDAAASMRTCATGVCVFSAPWLVRSRFVRHQLSSNSSPDRRSEGAV